MRKVLHYFIIWGDALGLNNGLQMEQGSKLILYIFLGVVPFIVV